MFSAKIKSKESGLLLYGITPPKATSSAEKLGEIAEKSLKILDTLDIDALVVYDVQDESARTSEERPFPFTSAIDPFEYTSHYLNGLSTEKIIYRAAGMFTKEELALWLDGLRTYGFHPVFVGVPAPDYVGKTTLKEAYEIWRENHASHSVIGAVTIPERHAILNDEDVRILDKVDCGVSFFISQCIFNVQFTKKILDDLLVACCKNARNLPTIIFTLTICGSVKTLQFMDWLGIHIPEDIKEDLRSSPNAAVRSKELAIEIARELIQYCQQRSIPFGFNIESVATRREEVVASLELLTTIAELLRRNGLRNGVTTPGLEGVEMTSPLSKSA